MDTPKQHESNKSYTSGSIVPKIKAVRPDNYTVYTCHGAVIIQNFDGSALLDFFVEVPDKEILSGQQKALNIIERRAICGIMLNRRDIQNLYHQLSKFVKNNNANY